jgi:DNA-directed RNA polymerase specialized sigma24 family protein
MDDVDIACVRAAIDRDAAALVKLFEFLAPVIQGRIAEVLRMRRLGRHYQRQDIVDLVHDVFAMLLEDPERILSGWDPSAGRSLKSYVGQRVEWFVISQLRAQRHATQLVELDAASLRRSGADDGSVENRELVSGLIAAIQTKWSDFGVKLFHQLFVLGAPSKQVAKEMDLGVDGVDQWRCRIRKFSRAFLERES